MTQYGDYGLPNKVIRIKQIVVAYKFLVYYTLPGMRSEKIKIFQ